MSFSAFFLLFLLVVWLAYVPNWLLRQIQSKKDTSTLYGALYKGRHAMPALLFYLFMTLLKIIYQFFESNNWCLSVAIVLHHQSGELSRKNKVLFQAAFATLATFSRSWKQAGQHRETLACLQVLMWFYGLVIPVRLWVSQLVWFIN